VTSYGSNVISVVNPTSLQTTTIPVGGGPTGIVADADGVWVAESLDGTVSLVDPTSREVVRTIRVGATTDDVALGDGSVWVSVHG
jgi:YVTN family beta-propeller protein